MYRFQYQLKLTMILQMSHKVNVMFNTIVVVALFVSQDCIFHSCITGLDYTIGTQDLMFYHNNSSGLNVSFHTFTDVLVEGNEVLEFVLSKARIHNLNNTNAVVYEPHKRTSVIFTDNDGEVFS